MSVRKMNIFGFGLAALTAVSLAFPGTISAARADTKIAVVDFQRIITQSKAGQALQKQVDSEQRALQEEVSRQQHQLESAQAQLSKDQDAAKSPDAMAQKKAEFDKKVIDTRQALQKRETALQKSAQESLGALRQQAGQIIADIASKEKYDVVLNRQAVLMASKSMDLTDRVLQAMDAKKGDTEAKPAAK